MNNIVLSKNCEKSDLDRLNGVEQQVFELYLNIISRNTSKLI